MRADVRREGARGRLARRRGARRHRADVQGHRVRPDDGRHQGDRDAVDRLPQRARVREDAGAGRRPHPDDRQGGAARHDHPPPRRTPVADDAEVVRRGHARPGAVHREPAGRGRRQGGGRRRTAADEDRLNDLLLPIVKGYGSEKSYAAARARVAADASAGPATCRTTRSSSTSATPRSTPCTRGRRRSRAWTCSSARSCATRARRSPRCSADVQEFAKSEAGNGRSRSSASCWPRPSRTCRASSGRWSAT